jgi:hypothetical protein
MIFRPLPKKEPAVFGLINPATEVTGDPGIIVSCHYEMADALMAQIEFDASQENPRTRIVKLRKFLPHGKSVDPKQDLLPAPTSSASN